MIRNSPQGPVGRQVADLAGALAGDGEQDVGAAAGAADPKVEGVVRLVVHQERRARGHRRRCGGTA